MRPVWNQRSPARAGSRSFAVRIFLERTLLHLLAGRRGGAFFLARTRQDARQRVIAFVARVFVELLRRVVHRQLAAERLRERRRILDRELVENLLRRNAREALRHLEILLRATEAVLR